MTILRKRTGLLLGALACLAAAPSRAQDAAPAAPTETPASPFDDMATEEAAPTAPVAATAEAIPESAAAPEELSAADAADVPPPPQPAAQPPAAPAPAGLPVPGLPVPGVPVSPFAASDDALPSVEGVDPRAPGMGLPLDAAAAAETLNNPFEPPPAARPKTPEEIEKEVREKAYNASISGLFPLNPSEIRNLLETYDKTKQAVEVPVYPYPEPVVTVETISLDPGVKPPEVFVAVGHVSTVTVMDVSGQPWPIQDISWAGNFEIIQPEEGSNIFRIAPMSDFTYGNMSIRLVNLNTPVTFILKTHRDKVHYRYDARITRFGPYAQAPLIQGAASLSAGDQTMAGVLDGVPPETAQRLDVVGVDGRTTAFRVNGQTYLRTPLTLLSPAWSSSASSSDGVNVYTLANASVVLLSDGGQVVRAKLVDETAEPSDEEKKEVYAQ